MKYDDFHVSFYYYLVDVFTVEVFSIVYNIL